MRASLDRLAAAPRLQSAARLREVAEWLTASLAMYRPAAAANCLQGAQVTPARLGRGDESLRQWLARPASASGPPQAEPAVLRALALAYGRAEADLGRLFAPPQPREWLAILGERTPDARFTNPPRTAPFDPLPAGRPAGGQPPQTR